MKGSRLVKGDIGNIIQLALEARQMVARGQALCTQPLDRIRQIQPRPGGAHRIVTWTSPDIQSQLTLNIANERFFTPLQGGARINGDQGLRTKPLAPGYLLPRFRR